MKDKYYELKLIYKDYIMFLNSGNFYICINNDAYILNKIFSYKIIKAKDYIKVGFLVTSLNKILMEINKREINYVVVNKDIVDKQKYKNNNYSNYEITKSTMSYLSRINVINSILKNNIKNPKIDEIIKEIEEIVCMINY